MLNYFFKYRIFLFFWDTGIHVIKAKYKIAKMYLIKEKYSLLFVVNIKFHLHAQVLFLITYFSIFWDAVIYVIKAKYKINKINETWICY